MRGFVRPHGKLSANRRASARQGSLIAALSVLLAAILLPAGCGGTQDASSPSTTSSPTSYTDIEPAQLAKMLEQKDFVLINTHIPYEGEIEQTDLFLAYDQAAELVDQLPADKDAMIVVYCRSDRMSRIAAEEWSKVGYTNLYNLNGGFEAWEAAGYPLLQVNLSEGSSVGTSLAQTCAACVPSMMFRDPR